MAKKILKILAVLAAMVMFLAVPATAKCKPNMVCKKIRIATGYKYVTKCYPKKKRAHHKHAKKTVVVKKVYVQAAMPANPFRGATSSKMERIVDPGSERMAKVAVAGVKALGYIAGQAARRPNVTKIANGGNRVNVSAVATAAAQAAASSSTNHSGGCQNGGCVKQPDVPSNYGNIAKKPGSNYGGVNEQPIVNPGPDL